MDRVPINPLVDGAIGGFIAIDRDWIITDESSQAEANSGFETPLRVGRRLWEAIPFLVNTHAEVLLRQAMERRKPAQFEALLFDPQIPLAVNVFPSHDGVLVSWQDTTARRQEEQVLQRLIVENRHQAALLDAIFAADPSGLAVVVGHELRFAYANPAYRYICPQLGAELINQKYEAVWETAKEISFFEEIQHVLDTGRPFQTQGIEREYPDGTERIFALQARRIDWEDAPATLIIYWDTTDLVIAERQTARLLEETHQQASLLQAVYDAMTDAILVFDTQGVLQQANPAAVQLFGFDPTQLTREEILHKISICYPDGRPMAVDDYPGPRALRGERVTGERVRFISAGGEVHHVTATATQLRDGKGQITGMVAALHDITVQDQNERELRDSRQKFFEILDSINDGFMELDHNWRFTYLNERAATNVGCAPEDLLGQNIWERFPGILGSQHEFYYRQVMAQHSPAHFEVNGSLTNKSYDVRVYPSADGITVYWVDITERKKGMKALHESEERYRSLFNYNPGAISLFEVVYNEQGEVIDLILRDANPLAARELPVPLEEALGRSIVDLYGREAMAENLTVCKEVMETCQGRQHETYFKLTGTWHLAWSYPVGSTHYTVGSINITERKQAEDAVSG